MRPDRALPAVAATVLALALPVLPAVAAWLLTSEGATATARADGLSAVTAVGATPASTSVVLSWKPPAAGPAPRYRVTRTAPTPAVVCDDVSVTTCTDAGLMPATVHSYAVVTAAGSWTGPAATVTTTTTSAAAPTFDVVVTPATPVAGAPLSVTLTARTAGGVDTAYSGSRTIAWSGLGTSPAPASQAPAYPAGTVVFASGVSTTTLEATAYRAGTQSLVATDGARTGGATVTVAAAAPTRLAFGGSSVDCTAGTAQLRAASAWTTSVTRTDPWSNPAPAAAAVTVTFAGLTATPASLSIPAGATTTSAATSVTPPNSNNGTTFTASAPGYAAAGCLVFKN